MLNFLCFWKVPFNLKDNILDFRQCMLMFHGMKEYGLIKNGLKSCTYYIYMHTQNGSICEGVKILKRQL